MGRRTENSEERLGRQASELRSLEEKHVLVDTLAVSLKLGTDASKANSTSCHRRRPFEGDA